MDNDNKAFGYGVFIDTDLPLNFRWHPIRVSDTGFIRTQIVNAPGTLIDSGTTAADNVTPPTLALSVRNFAFAFDGTNFDRMRISPIVADGLDPATLGNAITGQSIPYVFNETTLDRYRGNTQAELLASAARTASVQSADQTNYNARGLHVIINVSALAATPSIVPTIQGKDPVSGNYYDILIGNPITTTGINVLKVYPGISAIVNGSASDILPRTWRLSVAHGDADSITYSAGFALVL